jgi:3-oxoacyl-[acyl-carrier-protein] synthase-3
VRRARIVGTGSYLPPRVVTNAELARRVDTSDEWIVSRTGIRQRHIADESQSASDLALEASREALRAAGVKSSDLDLIIVATSTPDYVFPSTACLLQAKLGVRGCPAFDVQAVCSGFVYGLAVADALIRAHESRSALVVGAEVFSRILDWNDRSTCVLFGDGAAAAVLRADERPGVHATVLHADGAQADILAVPGNVCGGRIVGSPFVKMDGPAVFRYAVRVLDEIARETVAKCGMQVSDIDWLIPHQANIRILDATVKKLGLPRDRLVVTVDRHANTSAASVPLALDLACRDGRIKPGQRVMLQGVGGGFTWGASLVEI